MLRYLPGNAVNFTSPNPSFRRRGKGGRGPILLAILLLVFSSFEAAAGMIVKGESTIVQDEAASLVRRDKINMTGAGVTCADNSANARTDCTITGTGQSYATVQDEAVSLTQRSTLNMVGSGVSCADNAGTLATDCTISAGSGYATIQEEAVSLTQRATLNLVGTLVTCADNAGATRTDCTWLNSTNQGFLAAGALTCGAAANGKIQVHTTPLQYCDNAATPTLQYSAYGNSSGVATSATALAANGANCAAGNYPLGVDASGAVEGCTAAGGGGEADPATSFAIVDEFASGAPNTSGQIGSLGWMSGGCVSSVSAEANRPGIIRLDTSATANTQCAMWIRQSTGSGIVQGASLFDTLWYVRLNTNDANTLIRVGLSSNCGADTFETAYFEKLAADTTWFRVTKLGATQTRTDTAIAVSTAWVKMRVRRIDASTIGFTLDAAAEQTNTTNTPAGHIQPCVYIDNNIAAAKTADVDYFRLKLAVTR